MNLYRIRLNVDIVAHDLEDATRHARMLAAILEQRSWVEAVLPDGIEERRALPPETSE